MGKILCATLTQPVEMWILPAFLTLLLALEGHAQAVTQPDDVEAYLIFSSLHKIVRFNIDVTDQRVLQSNAGDTVALDFQYEQGLYYWSNQDDQTIYRAPLEGGPRELVVSNQLTSQVDGIAVDWVNNQLYWTDLAFGTIHRLDLDGFTNEVVLIATGIVKPKAIVLDPHNDLMYFTDINRWGPSIQRAKMSDGSDQEVIISQGIQKPNAVTLDYDTNRLFFADATTNKIESCDVDGSNRVVLFQGNFFVHPFDMSVYNDRIYWTELYTHFIVNAHKDTGSDRLLISGPFVFPFSIHIVHPSRQPLTDRNFCAANNGTGLCESLCTSYFNGYTCGCLDGYVINEDLHNCDDMNECSVDNGGCKHICNNLIGSFECQCIGGFVLEEDGVTCTDHNECNNNRAGCEYACHNTDSGYYCSCPVGYQLQADQLHCEDVNECEPVSPCPAEAQCVNHDGSYGCRCPTGFVFSAVDGTCGDVDECLSGQSSCTQRCDNQPGGHSCSCHDGFALEEDGITCTDINECEQNLNNCQQTCTNIIGSFVCLCYEGYRPAEDGHNCERIFCGEVDPIQGFTIQCTGTAYGSTCQLSCVQGTVIGVSSLRCQANGWSFPLAECLDTGNTSEANIAPYAVYPSSFVVPEDTLPGVALGSLHTASAADHESYGYTLTSDPSDKFYIDASDNLLRTRGGLDYETTLTYNVLVTTTDTGTPSLSGSFAITITVLDVNEPPTQPTLTTNTVREHASTGDQVGTLFASDSDRGQETTFSLVASGEGRFQLQGDQLLVAGSLNYEVSNSYIVVVQAQDNGTPMQTSTAQLTITVQDDNDPPTDIHLSAVEIAEVGLDSSTSAGTVIGALTTDDEDQGDSHTYTLGGASSGCFSIADSSLAVGDVSCFDHELNPTLSVQVTARDSHGLLIQQAFTVAVTDVNEPPSSISLSSSSVREHVAVDTVVGTLTVADPDLTDSHQLTVKTGDSLFAVSGNVLVVKADLRFSDHPAGVSVSVEAVDSAAHAYTETFTITVQNVNERPNDITWEVLKTCSVEHASVNGLDIHACVTENTAETALIATVTATDPDRDTLTLVLIDNGDIFNLDQNGGLTVGGNGLNFESPLVGQVHSISLIAEDPAGLTSTAQFNIKILDANDPPSNVVISNTMVGANTAVGRSAAILQCIDEDTGDSHTFRLISDAGGKFITDGNQLQVNQDLSSLAGNQYIIEVQCSDGITELSTPATFIIDVFEDGPITDTSVVVTITLSNNRIYEGQPGETLVGNLRAESTVSTGDFTFSVIGGASQLFSVVQAVSGSTATLRTTGPLDFEETSMHYVIIRAEAPEGSGVQTFVVTVRDVNEPPKDVRLEHSSIHENQIGALVGIVSAVDPEGDSINFYLPLNPGNAFELQTGATPNSQRLISKRALDFETEPTLSISLYARDPNSPSLTSDVYMTTVNVLNVNEAPTQIQISQSEIAENSAVGTTVGTLTVSDPDSVLLDQDFTCVLQESASGLFSLDEFSVKVSDSSRLDYESFAGSGEMPTIFVECSDSGGLSVSQHFEMTVTNVAERPTNVVSATGLFEIAENNEGGAVVAYLQTTDPDTDGADDQSEFQYAVSDSTSFSVSNRILVANVQLNYERRNRYDIEITTTDAVGLTFTKGISVRVLDRNDPPTGIVMSQIMTVSAQLSPGTIIATLEAQDEDTSQRHEFEIHTQTPDRTLQITGGNKLAIDEGSGEALSVEVTIVVKDLGVTTPLLHVQTFTIAVDDVNLPPTGIQLTGTSIVEGSAVGTVVGLVQVQDPSGSGETFYCVLLNDTGGPFDLAHRGGEIQLRVAYSERLNFESNPYLSIAIRCRDSLPENTVERTFIISVLDGPERPTGIFFINADNDASTTNINPPDLSDLSGQSITAATATVQEDAVTGFSVVAFIAAVDADGRPTSDQVAPEIKLITRNQYNDLQRVGRRRRGATRIHARSRRFAANDPDVVPSQFVVSSNGKYILVGDTLDYETQGEYMLHFKASDKNNPNLFITAQLRVVVLDIDEAPLNMNLSQLSVPESAAVDTVVGELLLDDPDGTASAYVYNIISHGTPFYLQNGKILVQRFIDHEVTPLITVQVMVSELNTDLQLTKNFDITVTNVPEPPTGLTVEGNTTIVIPETLEVGHYIGALRVEDPDSSAGFAFSFFVDEDAHSFFALSSNALLLRQRLNAWTTNVLSLFIRVTDPTGLSFSQVITVRVTSDDRCKKEGYCSPYATCLRGFCTCQPGFTGDGFTCTDINECSQYPCNFYNSVSGGCRDGLGGIRNFTCVCKEGWTGQDCTVEVNSCEFHRCNPIGFERCVNVRNSDSYTCQCKRGFQGVTCDENVDECVDHQCQNGGQCVDGVGLFTCSCPSPYEGYFCELDTSVCDNVKCPYNGTCLALANRRHECRCLDGVLQDCSACDFGYGGDNCDPCKSPFTGPNCDIDTSVCDPNPCPTEGVCKPDVDKYFCLCPENLAIDSCKTLVVAISQAEPTAQPEVQVFPAWIPVVLVCLALLAFTILFVVAVIRRGHRLPNKASTAFIPRRARFLSDSEQVIVYPEPDYLDDEPAEQSLQTFCPETQPREQTRPEPRPTAAPAAAPEAAATAEEPKDNPPPYSPPDNLFLASALGLIPPGYEAGVDTPEKKEKVNLDGDQAVADFIETVATPIGDRGTLVTKGSNLEEWEKDQLGLVDEVTPKEKNKRVRKKSAGQRPSVSRKLSVGAVAYQNPVFIPANTMPGNRAAVTQGGASANAQHPPAEVPASSTSGGNEKGTRGRRSSSSKQTGVPEPRRGNRLSISKSSSDVVKQNPVFQDSDTEGSDDIFE